MDSIEYLARQFRDEIAILQHSLERVEQGLRRTSKRRGSGKIVDTTQDWIETTRRQIAALKSALERVEREYPHLAQSAEKPKGA